MRSLDGVPYSSELYSDKKLVLDVGVLISTYCDVKGIGSPKERVKILDRFQRNWRFRKKVVKVAVQHSMLDYSNVL